MKTSLVPQTQSKGFAFEKEEGGNKAEFSPRLAETERRELLLTPSCPFSALGLVVGLLLRLVRADVGDDHAAVRLDAGGAGGHALTPVELVVTPS